MTLFTKLTLSADQPQQIIGRYSGVRVLEGAHHAIRIFDKDPSTASDVTRSRRLEYNGKLIVGPFINPWIMAVAQAPSASAPQLHLELITAQAAFVEIESNDLIHDRVVTNDNTVNVTASSETFIATTGNDNDGIGGGDSSLNHRGFWGGFVRASGAFRIELQAQDPTGGWTVLGAAESRNVSGHHSLCLDRANWDFAWSKASPATFGGFLVAGRAPVSHGSKSALVLVDTSASANAYTAMVAIRSR